MGRRKGKVVGVTVALVTLGACAAALAARKSKPVGLVIDEEDSATTTAQPSGINPVEDTETDQAN